MFKVGDKVKWTSSAAGISRTKEGVVIEVVLPWQVPRQKTTELGRPRREVSYVVRAFAIGTQTESKHVYWPRTRHLEAA